MSGQPISLRELRETATERIADHRGMSIDPSRVLALVEAVEVIPGLMDIAEIAMPDTYFQTDSRVVAARAALARFTDHKETRLCDCGRADVMDDRGLCGYCIEELDERHRDAEPEAPDGCP